MIAGGGVRKITIKEIRVQDFVRGKALNAVWTFRMAYKAGQVRIITVEQEGNNFKENGRCLSLVPDSTEFPASVIQLISFYFFVRVHQHLIFARFGVSFLAYLAFSHREAIV